MSVLLSGGGGFVGQHLQAALAARGMAVVAPSSAAWDVRNADRTDRWVRKTAPRLVVHLAAHTGLVSADRAPQAVRAVNVEGTAHVLSAVARLAPGARVVVVSTCHVYGPPQTPRVAEDHPLRPVGVYATSKRDAEALTAASAVDWVVVRPFHLVGPGQPDTHAASDWAHQGAAGAGTIRCGDLSLVRDFLDVRDAVAGLLRLAESAPTRTCWNLCRGEGWALADVLAAVAPGAEPQQDPARLRGHDVPRLVGDPSRLEALGWLPEIPIRESLAALRAEWDTRR